MPVQQILLQPTTNSLNAAYRPIVLRVQATSTTNYPEPPVLYCDVYVNGVFYRTLSKSQSDAVNDDNSEWQFDIQDVQEVFTRYIAPNGGMAMLNPTGLHALVFCRFRSSYIDDDNIIQPDPDVPVQATSSTDAVSGSGLQSNTFVVLNATLKQEDNPNLQQHLNSYKKRQWDALAFPLSHRPNNYILGRNDSDYFPFIYSGNKSVSCIKVTLNMKDGTTQNLLYCAAPDPCLIHVSAINIMKAPDDGSGRVFYNAAFVVSNTPDHYKIEVSADNTTWTDITSNANYNVTVVNNNSILYNAHADGTAATHYVRITPYCDDVTAGTGSSAGYTIPTCPTVTSLNVTYNPQTQIFAYSFIDAANIAQTVQLWRISAPGAQPAPYGVTYYNAPNTGNWTIIDGGDYYVTVQTACSIGTPVIETSNSITVTVSNPICEMPSNVIVNFTPDGNSLRADWTLADHSYSDLVKWYDADTNVLLLQGLVSPNVNFAVISVSSYPNVQNFYCTVQHQCPSPSTLGRSNTIQRSPFFILQLDYSSGNSIYVKCLRYNQLVPAPFTAQVSITLSYKLSGSNSNTINTVATNYIIYGNSQNYIYGSSDATIQSAQITSVSPSTQGGLTYLF